MADYEIPPYVVSRIRYFDGQFLRDQDFVDEQRYHIDRRQRHERLLHVAGIAEGLAISISSANDVITVTSGTAVDLQGRQILLPSNRTIAVNPAWTNGNRLVTIHYRETADHPAPQDEPQGTTRFTDDPIVETLDPGSIPLPEAIVLGTVTVQDGQAFENPEDDYLRTYSGLRLPGPAGAHVDLQFMKYYDSGDMVDVASLQGSLRVSGKTYLEGLLSADTIGIGMASSPIAEPRLEVNGAAQVNGTLTIAGTGKVAFNATHRQMLDLFDMNHGLGTQANTLYFRSSQNFAFYEDGSHHATALNAGTGGSVRMVITGDKVGIGTSSPAVMLDVNGAARSTGLTVTGGAILATSSGSVGIGTDAPDARLSVVNTPGELQVYGGTFTPPLLVTGDRIANTAAATSPLAILGCRADTNASVGLHIALHRYTNDGDINDTAIRLGLGSNSNTQLGGQIWLARNGNVGIGSFTSAPGALLDVIGTARVSGNLTVDGTTNKIVFSNTHRQMLDLYDASYGIGTQPSTLYFRSAHSFAFYEDGAHSATDLDPGSGGTARMVIVGEKVGIGTTNPNVTLTVIGPSATDLGQGSHTSTLLVAGGDMPDIQSIKTIATFGCRTSLANNLLLRIRCYRVGSGTGTTNMLMGVGMSYDTQTYGGGQIWLASNGNVGIGGNGGFVASERLEVAGNVKATNVAVSSSRELKQDISDLSTAEALAVFQALSPVKFSFKEDPKRRVHAGFIAEDVPDLVGSERRDAVSPNNILAVLTRVVQIQQETIERLEQHIEDLKGGASS